MVRPVALLLVVGMGVSACASLPVVVRFKNNSSEDFTHLDGHILDKAFAFDSLPRGHTTGAVVVPESYYYCLMRVVTKIDTLHFRPIDYVGEKCYTRGNLTIEVSIDSAKNRSGHLVRYITLDAARGRLIRHLKQAIRP